MQGFVAEAEAEDEEVKLATLHGKLEAHSHSHPPLLPPLPFLCSITPFITRYLVASVVARSKLQF